MVMTKRSLATLTLLFAGAAQATPQAELILLEDLPGAHDGMALRAVSADGETVTGQAFFYGAPSPSGPQLMRFDVQTQEFTLLPATGGDLRSASANAQTAFGVTFTEDPWDPGRFGLFGWFFRDGDTDKTLVPNQFPNTFSEVWRASADGSTIVGMINFQRIFNPCCDEFSDAYFWDLDTMQAPQTLPDLASGSGRTAATTVSADGQLFAGFAQFFDETAAAVIWDRSGGLLRVEVPGSDSERFIHMSANGRFIAGFALMDPGSGFGDFREDAFMFDVQTQTLTMLGQTPAPFKSASPTWVADDGSTVIGILDQFGFYDNPSGDAFIWTETRGLERLIDHVEANYQGVNFDAFRALSTAYTSGDGKTIVGNALTQDGCCMVPYVLRLDVAPSCPADLTGDGVVDADDFFLFLQLFAAGDSRADFNNDGVIDADDFFAYLSAFADGC
ncbi:MAG: hypothetical protein EA423_00155 [Phycisphaerales bacterium]|nr:MAG: hypothetical protein EA423_00155 [Phycisphaerales bacterium]